MVYRCTLRIAVVVDSILISPVAWWWLCICWFLISCLDWCLRSYIYYCITIHTEYAPCGLLCYYLIHVSCSALLFLFHINPSFLPYSLFWCSLLSCDCFLSSLLLFCHLFFAILSYLCLFLMSSLLSLFPYFLRFVCPILLHYFSSVFFLCVAFMVSLFCVTGILSTCALLLYVLNTFAVFLMSRRVSQSLLLSCLPSLLYSGVIQPPSPFGVSLVSLLYPVSRDTRWSFIIKYLLSRRLFFHLLFDLSSYCYSIICTLLLLMTCYSHMCSTLAVVLAFSCTSFFWTDVLFSLCILIIHYCIFRSRMYLPTDDLFSFRYCWLPSSFAFRYFLIRIMVYS